ncbi:MAG TPA: mechanosensitive ion channel protein MscS, partial [Cyanothece sp. UBA12306]|nr:mechanosensitive ion channel protein MscS [Cyanothece sp. UBA12306]
MPPLFVRWKLILLALLTLILTVFPGAISAQSPLINSTEKAPIIVDGRMLFEIGSISNFSAQQRANIINETLAEEVRTSQPVEVVVFEENEQTVIRNLTTKRHLLSVTPADVISGSDTFEQAIIWKKILEKALQRGQFERTPQYLRKAGLLSLGAILVAIAVNIGLVFLRIWGDQKWLPTWKYPTSPCYAWQPFLRPLWRIFILGSPIVIWLIVIGYICHLLPQARSQVYQIIMILGQRIFVLGDNSYSAIQLLFLLSLTVGLWFLVKGLVTFLRSYLLSRLGASQSVQDVVAVLARYILLFLGLIILLQLWGLDLSALAILASVLGVGIGFGLQNIANNFISGLIITLERPIQVGDFVKLGDL